MSPNPYQPPAVLVTHPTPLDAVRGVALRNVRLALLILLVPACYNFVYFNFGGSLGAVPLPIRRTYQVLNLIGFVSIAAGVWLVGLVLLEWTTRCIFTLCAQESRLDAWKHALYGILRRAPVLAVPGGVLWAIWTLAIYRLRWNFYAVSLPVGIIAHFLAACLYVPLGYRWFQIERQAQQQMTS